VVLFLLATGIVFSFSRNEGLVLKERSMPVLLSSIALFEKGIHYTTNGFFRTSRAHQFKGEKKSIGKVTRSYFQGSLLMSTGSAEEPTNGMVS
jgi:hypothetical protein